MAENLKKPPIRFKGFTDAWEQRKVGDLYEKAIEKNDLSYNKEQIISVANMYFKEECYITDENYLLTYNVFHLGDIAFEGNKSKNFAHGRFVENTIGDGIVSHVFDVFSPRMEYDLLYWKYAINNELLMGKTLIRSTKASTMMTNLVANDFLNESLYVPSVAEQKRIGTFLDNLDNHITIYQRKFDKLVNIKQSMLEKMFPKNGADVPEIRFKGFTSAWEQHKVGDYLTESRLKGNTGDIAKKITVKLWGKGVVEKNDSGGSEHTQYYKRKNGQFIYSKLDFLNSAFGVIPKELDGYESTADLPAFDLAGLNPYFLFYRVIRKDFYLKNGMVADGSRKAKRIHANVFLDMEIKVPELSEQIEISDYFQNLDNLITLHQHEIEKHQNLKKALLEKMFV